MIASSKSKQSNAFLAKDRLLLTVDSIVQKTLKKDDQAWKAQPEFVFALCEVVLNHLGETLLPDLAAFANHAKRKTVTAEDVQLAARKSPALSKKIETLIAHQSELATTTTKRAPSSKKKDKKSTKMEDEDEGTEDDEDIDRSRLSSSWKKHKLQRPLDDFDEEEEEEEEKDEDDGYGNGANYGEDDFFAD